MTVAARAGRASAVDTARIDLFIGKRLRKKLAN
jgi:hypothetical protein